MAQHHRFGGLVPKAIMTQVCVDHSLTELSIAVSFFSVHTIECGFAPLTGEAISFALCGLLTGLPVQRRGRGR